MGRKLSNFLQYYSSADQKFIIMDRSKVFILFTLFSIGNLILARNGCPSGFSRLDDKCYYISRNKENWFNAERFCRNLNSVLFAFDSERDQNLLTGNLQVLGIPFEQGYLDSIWTGITSLGTTNQTTFVLHHNGQELKYAKWCPNEPKNVNNLNCVGYAKIDNIFGYHNIECDLYNFPFACETRPVTTEDYLCLKKEMFVETQLNVVT